MDLNRFDTVKGANEGADMHIRHPGTGEPLFHDGKPVTIRLCGEDGELWRRAVRDAGDKRRSAGAGLVMDEGALEDEAAEVLAAITTGWHGITEGDHHVEFSREAVRSRYRQLPWLREQASAFKGNRANFVPAS